MSRDISVATVISAKVAMVASHKLINQQKPKPITLKIPVARPDVRQEITAAKAIKKNGFGNKKIYSTLDIEYSKYREISPNVPGKETLSQLTNFSTIMPGDI